MNSGRINSPESIRLASEVVRAFGSWEAAERASQRSADGVYVLRRSQIPVKCQNEADRPQR